CQARDRGLARRPRQRYLPRRSRELAPRDAIYEAVQVVMFPLASSRRKPRPITTNICGGMRLVLPVRRNNCLWWLLVPAFAGTTVERTCLNPTVPGGAASAVRSDRARPR